MENASKALLIAGSVLIVILLIAVGVRIFNSTQGTTDSLKTTMNATEIQMFNKKFTKYIGSNKSKAQATSLLDQVIINNSSENNHRVGVTFMSMGTIDGAANDIKTLNDVINGNKWPEYFYNKSTFKIEVDYDSNGYINLIMIY